MKKLLFYFLSATMLFVAGCSESFDDSEIWTKLDSLESRIATLEQLCRQMNTNISSLQTLVDALKNNDYVTGITPITEDGKTIGYTITFSKSNPVTIYHGKDGANGADGKDGKDGTDGYTPVIGVKQDVDGIYYWTLDGDWLLDANGKKIEAQGDDGKDGINGITPLLKIENDYWYISYDNGATWTELGKATGEDGTNGIINGDNDSIFQTIDTTNSDYVIFILADGTEIKIAKYSQDEFSIIFDNTDFIVGDIDELQIPFTIVGAIGNSEIDAIILSSDYEQYAEIEMLNETNGILHIVNHSWYNNYNVLVIASNNGKTTHKLITVRSGEIYLYDYFEISGLGGTIEVPVTTNFDYEVVIPNEYASWIDYVDIETRAELRNEVIVLSVSQNTEESDRYGKIELRDKQFGNLISEVYIYQMPLELRLSVNKTQFEANGTDCVNLTVKSGWSTLTENIEFYNSNHELIDIDNHQFKTTVADSYSLYAKYQGITSNTVHLLAKDENTPEYIAITGETGDDNIKCAVLGLDGSILYYYQNNSIPELVSKISKINNYTREVEFIINLDNEGRVKNILTPETTIVFGNYHNNLVDAMVFTSGGERIIIRDIEYNTADLLTRAPSGIEVTNLVVSGIATGLEIAAIASVGITAAGPIAITTAAIGAAFLAYDAATAFDLIDENTAGNLITHFAGHYGNLAGLAANFPSNKIEIIAALATAASELTGLAEMFESESEPEIIIGNGNLNTSECLSATLTWDGPADIDLHCKGPSGHIYYHNKHCPGGYLDNDNTSAYGPETIYYSNPKDGSYSFYIHYYAENEGVQAVNYTVKVNKFGEEVEFSGTISGQGSSIHIDTILIGSITNSSRNSSSQNNNIIDWDNVPAK